MIAGTVVAPAQAAADVLQAQAETQTAGEMAAMPCGDDLPQAAEHEMPCNCCTPATCDLSACLGTACLPELPRLVAAIPPPVMPLPWNDPAPPSLRSDTPLRPPIA